MLRPSRSKGLNGKRQLSLLLNRFPKINLLPLKVIPSHFLCLELDLFTSRPRL